ncbi:MAG: hypothetical protein HOW73_00495 [Polyangiaceae bacterium]|nr:hypothetical protein [Polyangiaceae bacterium]
MAPLPGDVSEALGIAEHDTTWVRIRSSLGSIIGETFLISSPGRMRVAMRTSALADLEELTLAQPPAYEESENAASVVVVRDGQSGANAERIHVGYLEREEVRAFFQASTRPAPVEETGQAEMRVQLVSLLRQNAIDTMRAKLVTVLAGRNAARRAELTKRAAEAKAPETKEQAIRRAEREVRRLVETTPRLDARIGALRKRRRSHSKAAREIFDDAIEAARDELRARAGEIQEDRERSRVAPEGSARSRWLWYFVVVGVVVLVLWYVGR